jgi:hypothetical protein
VFEKAHCILQYLNALCCCYAFLLCTCRHVLKMLGPRTKGSAALARAATLLQKKDDLSQLLASTLKLPPEHRKWLRVCVIALHGGAMLFVYHHVLFRFSIHTQAAT